MFLSICICTFNRAQSLRDTLDSLLLAVAQIDDVEIVVVDNNSRDNTAKTIGQFALREISPSANAVPVRYHFEARQGLAIARNTAVKASKGELLLFTDDDTLWSEGSVKALIDDAKSHPRIGFFGGRMLAKWPKSPPAWLREPSLDLLAGVLGHYDLANSSRALTADDPLPYGANFAVRKDVLDVVGTFDEALGVIGERRGRGEDTDLLQRAVQAGYSGRFVAEALCMHRVDPRNLQLTSLYQMGVEKGLLEQSAAGKAVTHDEPRRAAWRTRFNQLGYCVRGLVQLVKGRGDRFRQCIMRVGIEQGAMQRDRE